MKSTRALYINIHKLLIIPIVLGLMSLYDNFSIEAYIYLALHGTYSLLWFLKFYWFRDEGFRVQIPVLKGVFSIFLVMTGYYVAPFILISQQVKASPMFISVVLFFYIIGIFFHFVSDIQKYYTLKYKKGLITEGMFSRTRNPNYFGEIIMYLSLALFSKHWLPFVIIVSFTVFVFLKIMKQKDAFLSQFPEFEAYKKRSWLLFPKFF
ncbi:methyltransferase family protein [Aquimarina rubra]|uniref:Methyltransferase family protein n=1 Tax=Aquimarina rubra TaxID=1920033 RepID=A0ABW5L8K3_9FLAO